VYNIVYTWVFLSLGKISIIFYIPKIQINMGLSNVFEIIFKQV